VATFSRGEPLRRRRSGEAGKPGFSVMSLKTIMEKLHRRSKNGGFPGFSGLEKLPKIIMEKWLLQKSKNNSGEARRSPRRRLEKVIRHRSNPQYV
jgi:hypothetical protein